MRAIGLAIGLVLGAVIVPLLYGVVRKLPRSWPIWGAVVMVLFPRLHPPGPAPADAIAILNILSAVHLVALVVMDRAAVAVTRMVLRRSVTVGPDMFAPVVVQFALRSLPAGIGCVAVLLAGIWGILPRHPWYYLNLAGVAIYVLQTLIMVRTIHAILVEQLKGTDRT